jgi:nicotinamidase/pyrazinamidase
VAGLTSDYCVAATAWDAVHTGFRTTVLEDLCAGVSPETTASVRTELTAAGVPFVNSDGVVGEAARLTRPTG